MDEVQAQVHGDLDSSELDRLGVDRERLLDLGVNVSPFGPHPRLEAAIRAADLASYPDRNARAAKAAIARATSRDVSEIILGNGAAELIWTAVRLFSGPSRSILVVGPTFGEVEAAAASHGVAAMRVDAAPQRGFELEPAMLDHALGAFRPALVYLCQPNNPTGKSLGIDALLAIIERHGDIRFLVDQAFLSLSDDHEDVTRRFPNNAIVLRSLTKDHALAGVRVAYALGNPSDIAALEGARPPWTVSTAAQVAAVHAMEHEAYVTTVRERLLSARDELVPRLRAFGLEVVDSRTFFVLVRVGAADALRRQLLTRHAIAVRSCTSFGLPDHMRIAARDAESHDRLLAALAAELG